MNRVIRGSLRLGSKNNDIMKIAMNVIVRDHLRIHLVQKYKREILLSTVVHKCLPDVLIA
jgi:hypothetical protein